MSATRRSRWIDFAAKTIQVPEERLAEVAQAIPAMRTLKDVWRIFGKLFHWARVVEQNLSDYFFCPIKFYRKLEVSDCCGIELRKYWGSPLLRLRYQVC